MYYIEQNRALEKMRAGKFALGFQLRSRSPLIAELLGHLGFDFLYIETEHFACNDETIENLVRAAQITGITPWIRITNTEPEYIEHLLDIGIKGIIVPHLDTGEQALKLVHAIKYPPEGRRGSGMGSRAADFGLIKHSFYLNEANRNCSAIGMIESTKAIENLEEILKSGIDMIRIGMNDLLLETGYESKEDPRFLALIEEITATAAKYHVPVGASAVDSASATNYQSLGFQFLCLGSDIHFLQQNLPSYLQSVRQALDERNIPCSSVV